jgi:PhnB protein
MSEHEPADRLDELVDAMLTGRAAAEPEAPLADLLHVAGELRGLPTEEFRVRLGAALETAAAEARKGAVMTTATTSYIREGFTTVTPYLRVEDVAGLLDFITRAFGATEAFRAVGSAGGLHAEARIGDSMLMMGGFPGIDAMPTSLHLYVADADGVYAQAIAAGARSLRAPTDQPYGDREASVQDLAGNQWYIGTRRDVAGGRPEGLRTVTPYLHPRSANRLIGFLEAAFGAEETFRHEMPGRGVAHAKVRIGDAVIEMGDAHGPWQPMPTAFYLYVPDVEALYARALGAGATSLQPPADQPYGDRTAHVADPFGNVWYLATHVGPPR